MSRQVHCEYSFFPSIFLEDWKIFKDGFLHLNHYFRPEDLVEIKTCALGDGVTSALAPASQKVFS